MKQTVYTASPESQQIHVWSLEADGKLTLVQVVDAPGQVQPMVVSPNKEFLYVGVRPEFRVLAYRITPDNGALTFAGEAALPGSPTHISTDRHGRFVFSASYNQGCVSVTPLHDGLPGETITVVEGLEGCHSANISPDNRTLWVPALKQDRICLFTLSDDGFLSAQEPAEVTTVEGAGPRHMVFHPNQQYGYCVNELNSSIDVWELKDPKGNIECVQTLDMMPPDFSGVRWAADIHITRMAVIFTPAIVPPASSRCSAFRKMVACWRWKAISLPRPSRAALTSITAVNISLPPGRSRTISRCTILSVSRDCCRRKAAMRLGRGRCGWWSTPTEPPSGKRKNLALARFFLLRADRLCGEGVVLAGQKRGDVRYRPWCSQRQSPVFFGSRPRSPRHRWFPAPESAIK